MKISDDFLRGLYLPRHLRMNRTCCVENCRLPLSYAVFWTGKSYFSSDFNFVYDLHASCGQRSHLLESARNELYGEYDFIVDLKTQEFLSDNLETSIKDQLILEGLFKSG